MEGTRISHYRILQKLGAGGMGEVYLAEDTKLGRKAALKLLGKEFTTNRDRLSRFEQEACAASALNHPNILTIHEVGLADGYNFIATEFVDDERTRRHRSKWRVDTYSFRSRTHPGFERRVHRQRNQTTQDCLGDGCAYCCWCRGAHGIRETRHTAKEL